MDKLDLQTPNFTNENIQKLSELFPNCVTEDGDGKTIDFDALKQELSNHIVEGNKERYELSWPGKAESLVAANTPINKTLRPNRAESKDFDNTENLYIEGDNLEALQLLQETYLGKVKVVYVDPPYNTGNDILYKNDFSEDQFTHSEKSGEIDAQGIKAITNLETNGRYHSDWLSDMYSKITLSKKLLTDDGIFIITIDHYELFNLGNICDDIFGYGNRLGLVTVYINPKGRQHERFFSAATEYMLVYAKNRDMAKFNKTTIDEVKLKEFIYSDDKGKYRLDPFIRARSSTARDVKPPEFWYPIYVSRDLSIITTEKHEGYHEIFPIQNGVEYAWKTKKNTFNERNKNQDYKAIEKEEDIIICNKFYEQQVFRNIWMDKKYFPEFQGTRIVKELFDDKNIFPYPKSIFAIKDILKIVSGKDSIILDFFSGSATSAHSTMLLNAEDDGKRKFIMVQIPETTDEKSEAYKEGYKNIAEIGKERIRRAGEKIKKDNIDKDGIDDLDIGFRVLKVDSSNMKDIYFTPDETNQSNILDLASNIKEDRSSEDLLFMVLLSWGIDLSAKIEKKEIGGKEVYFVDDNYLVACFDENLDENFIKALINDRPPFKKAVLRDSSFASSSVRINVEQIFVQANIEAKVI
jgi:adenine-specific DNA-methyltransferase